MFSKFHGKTKANLEKALQERAAKMTGEETQTNQNIFFLDFVYNFSGHCVTSSISVIKEM